MAQNESAMADENTILVNAPEFSIVRNWQNTFTISSRGKYLVKDNFGMVSATTGTVPYFSALITDSIPNLIINDMKFVDNYAFICGHVNVSGSHPCGVLGYFDVNSFYSYNTIAIKLHVYDTIRDFSKMVAYKDVSDYKVVAIGTNIQLGYIYPSCVVEDNVMNIITFNNFKYFPYTPSSYPRERVTDLVIINDMVVFVGSLYDVFSIGDPHNALCIRPSYKHDVLNTLDTRYVYDTGEDEINGKVYAAFLYDDYFAVSYVYPSGNTSKSTRIRTIDLNSMDIICSQEFRTYEKDEPKEMAYDRINNILTLLHPMPFSYQQTYSQSYFVQINPFATSLYAASVLSPKTGLFSSLDMFNNVYYVSTGENHWYYQHTIAPQPNYYGCPENYSIYVKPMANPDKKTSMVSLLTYSVINTELRLVNVNPTILEFQCNDN